MKRQCQTDNDVFAWMSIPIQKSVSPWFSDTFVATPFEKNLWYQNKEIKK
jgi:hypothetical protein